MKKDVPVESAGTAERKTPFNREAILQVLDRAPYGYKFLARLAEDPCEVLQEHDLNSMKRAALASGDLRLIESRDGKLKGRLKEWLIAELQEASR